MKSTIIGHDAVTNGVDNAEQFGFLLDAHSFNLFASGLYSDKVLAVLREYTTNAIDSVVEAGNQDKGYTVHLPNTLEPFWSIRDYGTGIPDDDMKYLFTFNHSTRRKSNDFNGTFGLGSKSFLAISDSATFTSFYNGKKYVYFVFKDKGLPTYTKIEECDTEEENGLEVRIPVAINQFNDLITKYKIFCKWVDIQPTIIGYSKDNWNLSMEKFKDEIIDLGNNCYFGHPEFSKSRVILVFGNVTYTLKHVPLEFEYKKDCIIKVPIGSVDIVPSREELSMTDTTKEFLCTLGPMFKKQVEHHIADYYSKNGFIKTINYVKNELGYYKYKVNGKDSSLKLDNCIHVKQNYKSVKVTESTNIFINHNSHVLLDFEPKLKRYTPRLKKYMSVNYHSTAIIITDPKIAEQYCEYYEIDISTLTHLKDIEPPELNRTSHSAKGYRFSGFRQLEPSYAKCIRECPEMDLSDITTIYFLYRENEKIYLSYNNGQYLNYSDTLQLKKIHSTINENIYLLTFRQIKQCEKVGIKMINVMDHIQSLFDPVEFELAARYKIYHGNNSFFSSYNHYNMLIDILPEEFRFVKDVVNSKEYTAWKNIKPIYNEMECGKIIIKKYEDIFTSFLQTDIGLLIDMYINTYTYRKCSKDFFNKILEYAHENIA